VSALEETFAGMWELLGNGRAPVREYRFDTTRRWRFDFAWPAHCGNADCGGVAVETEGGTWSGGRHTRGKGFEADCEKYNAALTQGWLVLRYTPTMLKADPIRVSEQVMAALSRMEVGSGDKEEGNSRSRRDSGSAGKTRAAPRRRKKTPSPNTDGTV
jgi:hypothetical protein